jgi:hypothetical protein
MVAMNGQANGTLHTSTSACASSSSCGDKSLEW